MLAFPLCRRRCDGAAPSQSGGINCFQALFQQQQPVRVLADHSQNKIRLWWPWWGGRPAEPADRAMTGAATNHNAHL
jgi:hypothetical protein